MHASNCVIDNPVSLLNILDMYMMDRLEEKLVVHLLRTLAHFFFLHFVIWLHLSLIGFNPLNIVNIL